MWPDNLRLQESVLRTCCFPCTCGDSLSNLTSRTPGELRATGHFNTTLWIKTLRREEVAYHLGPREIGQNKTTLDFVNLGSLWICLTTASCHPTTEMLVLFF